MAQTEQLVVQLEARIRDFERNMNRAGRTARTQFSRIERRGAQASRNLQAQFEGSAAGINSALSEIGVNFGGLGGIGRAGMFGAPIAAAGAYVVALRRVSAAVADTGAEARRAGLGVEDFQELRYAAEQSRVTVSALTDGIKELQLRADEFVTTGGGSAAEAFARLGYSATDLKQKLSDPVALFDEIIQRLRTFDTAAQIRISDEIFGGTGGEQFVQLLDEGARSIGDLRREARESGAVLDEALVRRAEEIDRRFAALSTTLGTQFKGAILEVAGAAYELYNALAAIPRAFNAAIDASREAGGGIATGVAAIDAQINTLKSQIEEHRATHNEVAIGALEGRIEELRVERELIAEAAREFNRANGFARAPAPAPAGLTMEVTPAPGETTVIPPAGNTGGGGGGVSRESTLERETAAINQRIAALQVEAQAVGLSAFEADKLRTAEQLLNAAREGGVAITPRLRTEIDQLALGYAMAAEDVRRLEEAQASLADISGQIADGFTAAFTDMLMGAKSAEDAIRGLIQQVARLLLQKALGSIFGSIFGALGFADGGPVQGFASGGHVRGPGSSRSDSIPAVLSNGEFVVRASEAARHRELLERINAGRLPAFANGGAISSPSLPTLSATSSREGMNVTIAPTITIEGGSQGPEADEALAKRITREMEQMTRQVVVSEMRQQMRPGGMVNNVRS